LLARGAGWHGEDICPRVAEYQDILREGRAAKAAAFVVAAASAQALGDMLAPGASGEGGRTRGKFVEHCFAQPERTEDFFAARIRMSR